MFDRRPIVNTDSPVKLVSRYQHQGHQISVEPITRNDFHSILPGHWIPAIRLVQFSLQQAQIQTVIAQEQYQGDAQDVTRNQSNFSQFGHVQHSSACDVGSRFATIAAQYQPQPITQRVNPKIPESITFTARQALEMDNLPQALDLTFATIFLEFHLLG
jgi:hypothetical protein